LQPGARLVSVWVDGQRGATGGYISNALNVVLYGGSGTEAASCVFSNTAGWSTLVAGGSRNSVSGNLVTAYSSDHYDGTWSDGLSIPGSEVLVAENQIVDASDGGIVVYSAAPAQKSIVRNNIILSAGNSTYGGLIFDTGPSPPADFAGASFANNILWSGPTTHFDIVLSVGTQAWWYNAGGVTGSGASATGNSSGGLTIRCNSGIAIDGMVNATVAGNAFRTELVNISPCPSVAVGADVLNGHASGVLQTNIQTVFHSCIGH